CSPDMTATESESWSRISRATSDRRVSNDTVYKRPGGSSRTITSRHLVPGRHHSLRALGRPVVAPLLPRRQLDVVVRHFLVGDEGEEMAHQVEVCRALVICLDHVPRRLADVRIREHLVLRL